MTADHAFATLAPGVSTPTTSSYESIRETLNRRLLALAHLRQGHEGYAVALELFNPSIFTAY
jgi:hypothetical protein